LGTSTIWLFLMGCGGTNKTLAENILETLEAFWPVAQSG
jgi:hypothetical protein